MLQPPRNASRGHRCLIGKSSLRQNHTRPPESGEAYKAGCRACISRDGTRNFQAFCRLIRWKATGGGDANQPGGRNRQTAAPRLKGTEIRHRQIEAGRTGWKTDPYMATPQNKTLVGPLCRRPVAVKPSLAHLSGDAGRAGCRGWADRVRCIPPGRSWMRAGGKPWGRHGNHRDVDGMARGLRGPDPFTGHSWAWKTRLTALSARIFSSRCGLWSNADPPGTDNARGTRHPSRSL